MYNNKDILCFFVLAWNYFSIDDFWPTCICAAFDLQSIYAYHQVVYIVCGKNYIFENTKREKSRKTLI